MVGIITLNQDTFTNPTLYSLIKKLNDQQQAVGLFCGYLQAIPEELTNVQQFEAPRGLSIPRRPGNALSYLKSFLNIISEVKKYNIKHLIAVDQQGLILAGRVFRFQKKIRIHYISFEIFFEEELQDFPYLCKLKRKEIFYTAKATSIIIQDPERKKLLIKENKISNAFKSWYLIPVSPIISKNVTNKVFKKTDFGLKSTDIVYVHSGSIAGWAGIAEIIEAIESGLPENTYILIHNKYKFDPQDPTHAKLYALKDQGHNILLHDEQFISYAEYCAFLNCFDYGIVLYKPDGNNFTGINIKEIGLASGKFSTYMFCGLPSVLSACKTYEELIEKYPVGVIATDEKNLSYHIRHNSLKSVTGADCAYFYEAVLDAGKEIETFIKTLD